MDHNPQIELAWRYIEQTGVSVFLTGKAGTGKTTFLQEVVRRSAKRLAVVAPTGVAAINAGGVTIHSFFRLPTEPYLPDVKELMTEYQMPSRFKSYSKERLKIFRTLELLIIDEISMVRADLLDAVDMTLRRTRRSSLPFGGVQLLMIGDVHQLAPVVTERERPYMEQVYPTPYFFASKALQRLTYATVELTTIYRQQDQHFVELLNRVRNNQIDASTLALLNSRVAEPNPDAITLTTHNRQADAINRRHMDALKGKPQIFSASITGEFPERSYPCESKMELKVGERVMFTKNDTSGLRRYYNGMLATIVGFDFYDESEKVEVVNDEGEHIDVGRETWENMKYSLDPNSHEIVQEVEGKFSQYPLQPAWAVTIHKAQGLTFDHVTIDAAEAFAFGQVYVALSRCRSLEGLTLTSPISANVAFEDKAVNHFVSEQPAFDAVQAAVPQYEQAYRLEKLMELFGVESLEHETSSLCTHLGKVATLYPTQVALLGESYRELSGLQNVCERFKKQLMSLNEEQQNERAVQGSHYFLNQLESFKTKVVEALNVEIDNKELRKTINEVNERLTSLLDLKMACLKAVSEQGYSVSVVQKAKAAHIANEGKPRLKPKATSTKQKTTKSQNRNALVERLRLWRLEQAQKQDILPFVVMHQRVLLAIANSLPRTKQELKAIPGIGSRKIEQYGDEILAIVASYLEATPQA